MQIVWFKRDLRVTEHKPLLSALEQAQVKGLVLTLYIHEPSLIADKFFARQHQCFIQECLEELDVELINMGGGLAQEVGEAVEVFAALHAKEPITRIVSHRETTQKSHYARDNAVRAWAKANKIEFVEFVQNNVIRGSEPESKKLSFSDYFSDAVKNPLPNPTGKDYKICFHPLSLTMIPSKAIPLAVGIDKPLRYKGGRSQAKALAGEFFQIGRVLQYPHNISSPLKAIEGCSKLSAYLAYGVVSDREIMQKLDWLVSKGHAELRPVEFNRLVSAAQFFMDRLMWRQGYHQQFEHHPSLEDTEFYAGFIGLRESEHNPEHLEAWKAGKTGEPYIDAIQRCLDQTGWINMRARATLVSYACMQLWLPWQDVMEHLAHQFIDFDMAIHAGQHRIASGTSQFSQLLIYNPHKQSNEHDPYGKFMRQWVPELAGIKGDKIHSPWDLSEEEQIAYSCRLGEDYPKPLVNNRVSLERAKQKVNQVRSKPVTFTQNSLF